MRCDGVFVDCAFTLLVLASGCGLAGAPEDPVPRSAPKLRGSFRLEKNTYCVGEPIFAIFEAVNEGDTSLTFWVGGVESGRSCVRQSRFAVTVEDDSGRLYEPPPAGIGSGRSGRVMLEPGGGLSEYLWLSGWTRLLPPGKYTARAVMFLRSGMGDEFGGLPIRGSMAFTVVPYDYEKMKAAILRLPEDPRPSKETTSLKPVHWALMHVARTFNISYTVDSKDALRTRQVKRIASELPKEWDDRFYLEPELVCNRNWLTAASPEEFTATFSVRNNSRKSLPTGIPESRLYIDGNEVGTWKEMLTTVAEARRLDRLESGEVVEFRLRLNDYVRTGRRNQFAWRINGRTLRNDYVTFR